MGGGAEDAKWLKFTAEDAGDYLFSAVSKDDDIEGVSIQFFNGLDAVESDDLFGNGIHLDGEFNYGPESESNNPAYTILSLNEDDTVYLMAEPDGDVSQETQEQSFNLRVTKVVEPNDWTATGSGDSSYSASVGNRTVTITPVIGYTSLSFNINTGDSEYTHVTYTVKNTGDNDNIVSGEIDNKDEDGNYKDTVAINLGYDRDENKRIHLGTTYSLELSIEIEKSEQLDFSSEEKGVNFTTRSREIAVEELSLEEKTEVSLETYSTEENAKWLKYTAEADGVYKFWFNAIDESDILVDLYKNNMDGEVVGSENVYDDFTPWYSVVGLDEGESVYIKSYPYSRSESNDYRFEVQVSKQPSPEESAESLELDQLLRVSLDENRYEDDAKWLKFTAADEGDYRFRFDAADSMINVKLYKDSPDGIPIGGEEAQEVWYESWSTDISLDADQQVYIQAWPYDAEEGQSFDVKVTRTSSPKESAEDLELDQSLTVSLDDNRSEEEAKWLRFTALEEGSYQFGFETIDSSDIWVYLYNDPADEENIGYKNIHGGAPSWEKTVRLLKNQQVYVKAYPYSDGDSGSFNVKVSRVITPEDSAQALLLDRLYSISLDNNRSEEEAKLLKFTAEEKGEYEFWFNTKNGSDIKVYLYQDSTEGVELGYKNVYGSEGDGDNPWSKTVDLKANQQIYIKAYPYYDGSSGQTFDVRVTKKLTPEESAEELVLGSLSNISVNGYDEDKWLKFTAAEAGDYLFWFDAKNYSYLNLQLRKDSTEGEYIDGGYIDGYDPWSKTVGLDAKQTVYIRAHSYDDYAQFAVKVSKVMEVTDHTQNEDGSYQAAVNGRTITVTPDVGYRSVEAAINVSPQTYARVEYVFRDENGEEEYYSDNDYDWERAIGAQNGRATLKFSNLEMGKKYFLEITLLIDGNEKVIFAGGKNPLEFTTLSIEKDGDDRSIAVSVTPRLNRANLRVTLSGKAAEYNDNDVWVFYKKASDQEWTAEEYWLYGTGTETISISDLVKETEYDYVVGFTKGSEDEVTPDKLSVSVSDSFTTLKDDRTISRVDITPYVNNAAVEITLSGKAAIDNDNLVLIYYKEKAAEQWEKQSYYIESKDTVSIATYNGNPLKENTAYEYEMGFAENTETTQENLISAKKGEFSTIKDDREVSVTVDEYLNKAQVKAAISGNAAKNVTNYIYFYFREQGAEEWDSVLGTRRGVGTYSRDITEYNGEALKQGATYEYECGFGDGYSTEQSNLNGVKSGTFTIPTDDRKVTVKASDITAKVTSASIRAMVTGKTAEGMTNYVLLYYKDSDSADGWMSDDNYITVTGSGVATINLSSLDPGKTYDYVIGLGDSYYTNREELTGTATGTFTTATSTLELTDAKLSVGYQSVQVQASFAGNNTGSYEYIYFFYKPKNADGEESWGRLSMSGASAEEYTSTSRTVTGLIQDTAYDYAVVITDDYWISSPDEVTNEKLKKTSDFTTKKSAYSLTVTEDQNKRTHDSTVLNVSATGGQDEKLYVTLNYAIEYSDGTVGYVRSKSFNLRQISGYSEAVEIANLGAGTTYVVRSADIKVQDNTTSTNPYNWTTIDTITFDNVKFTTANAKVPEKITVTPEKVTLNLRGNGDGISYKSLKADIAPADAAKDLDWESQDYSIADVRVDEWDNNVYIYPVGVGTTKIYARSSYNSEVYGVCEVTVVNYSIRNENGGSLSSTTLSKGKTLTLSLYDNTEGKNVEDFGVEVYRSTVASWNKGVLTANAVGTTDVVFTAADGGKAVMNLKVTPAAESKGFGITGLTSSNSNYPAKGDNGSYKVAKGYRYTAEGEISPTEPFNRSDFTWTSSDESIATVANGVIKTEAVGSVTITVTPVIAEGEESPYKQDKVEIKLTVQDLPSVSSPTVYALTNLDGTKGKMILEDVDIVKTLGTGWSWVYPDTPLYSLPTNRQAYAFDAVYSGAEYYPCETKVNVYIGTVTGVSAYELDEYYDEDTETDYSSAWHNNVLAVSGGDTTDTLCLAASIGYSGSISSDVVVSIPSQDGLTIEEKTWRGWDDYDNYIEQQVFLIKATKAGTYDLKPQVVRVERDASGKITKSELITQTSYKIQAVENPQVGSIEFTSDDKNIAVENGHIYLDYTADMKNKTFNLTAIVRDRQGNRIDTALQWKVTDGAVAAVKAGRDTHAATVTVKGDGHAVLSVAAKDAAGYTEEVALEFRDHKPRVSTNKASVNLAYDYDTQNGRSLAKQKLGVVEIASVYGERIEYARLYEQDGVTPVTNMLLYGMSINNTGNSEYVVAPVHPDSLSTGTYQYRLAVKSAANKTPYLYDLKVTVTDKAPKVTAKMQDAVNLFYLNGTGSIKLSVSSDYPVSGYLNSVAWKQQSTGVNNGFNASASNVSYNTKSKGYLIGVSQQQIQMNGKNLVDSDIATGTLTVKLNGIRKPIVINNFKMKWNYKKPTLKTEKSMTNVVPETGNMTNYFMIRDSVTKQLLDYDDYDYDISCSNTNVTLNPYYVWVDYTYNGNNSKENLTLTVESDYWRETLTAKHTIKKAVPKAYLTKTQLTYNLAYKSEDSTSIQLKDAYGGLNLRDVAIEGGNANAKKLLEDDIFEIYSGEYSTGYLTVKLNKAALMNVTPKKGTYTFKLTPYYAAQDGGKVAMNTLNLKLKVEDKEPTVTISTKGKLDLAQSRNSSLYNNNICLKASFKNIGSDYKVRSAEVVGEYSDYFTVRRYQYGYWDEDDEFYEEDYTYAPTNYYYLMIKNMNSGYYEEYGTGYGKLKAGQTYKLNIVYTVETASGDQFTVTSAKGFTVKPVQTAPKITVKNNGQTFYAGASSKYRYYDISVPTGYYIRSYSGSLDCNKDGIPDIVVASEYFDDYEYVNETSMYVYIADEDAVTATAKGKTYNIPVTVQLIGRDGVAKDATTTIKVVVKR